ncbi:sulfotransferase family protein [Salinibacter ruber]|uniref:sulfotransferase family protein n=1 Tax=Salinibacter ruber TaxID=146919 RepID=UPI002167FB0B|nr:sulfotransferase [Salinibacter ruber]MCS3755668.1 uncharacterized protein YqiB (DUF1249 family) [Salinibacter ruber]
MPTPLFVVGKHRSGTTWLSNLLLDHPQIAGIQHEAHRGIHESAFFSHVEGRYGDLSVFSNYVEFASVVSRSDYFRLAGVSFDELMKLYPSTYAEVFRAVMDQYAEQRGVKYWIEKSPMHTHYMRQIVESYPDAQFVGIWRNPVDAAFSWLKCQKGIESPLQRLRELGRFTVNKYIADVWMKDMKKECPERVYIIQYESLVDRREEVLDDICQFLNVATSEVRARYAANTSYSGKREEQRRPKYEIKFVQWLYYSGLRVVPGTVFQVAKRFAQKREPLPHWFFKILEQPQEKVQ